MSVTFNRQVTLETEECCNCGVMFAMPTDLKKQCIAAKSSKTFYCPNGHPQHYVGKTDAEKLREAESERDQARGLQRLAEQQRDRVAAEAKREKKRVVNGVCPCCNRTFQNVARHMKTKHPKEVKAK